MKILVVGDFHGKCNIPLKKIIKDEKIDLILSPGDYCGDKRVANLFFKYLYDTDEDVPDKIEKRIDRYEIEGTRAGFEIIKRLKGLETRFIGVRGNWDPMEYRWDVGGELRERDSRDAKKLTRMQNKSFEFIDLNMKDIGDFLVIGGASSTSPGKINKKALKVVKERDGMSEVKRRIREYNRRKSRYEKMFSYAKKKKKPVIFLTHNCPYKTKLDKVRKGPAKGEHCGSFLEKEIIKKFKPGLVICGHMHENQGKDKIGKSLIINAGAVVDRKYAIIDFSEKTKVKFFR